MIITYLYHSGFAVELDKHVLLFDYYTGEGKNHTKQSWELPAWDKEKQICVFVSHKHHDHFDMNVFKLAEIYPKLHFFLGSDVKLSEKYLERNGVLVSVKEKLTNLGKNRQLEYNDIAIETLRSTDAGVAFLVYAEGKYFYHAGDLNWWHWEEESVLYNENMERAYRKEIDMLEGRHFHVAFVPLDPRLGDAYRYGMDYFCSKVTSDYIFPMHMWEQYDWIQKYKKTLVQENNFQYDKKDCIMEMKHAFEQFHLE